MIGEVEAYSYKDIDALIEITWADQGFTPFIFERLARVAPTCSTGGDPGGPPGYFYMERPQEYGPDLFYDADPAVIAKIADDKTIRARYAAIADAAAHAATPQIRNMATLGGNILQRPLCWYFRNELFHCRK